jgi:sugar lactone lactonase YvrE
MSGVIRRSQAGAIIGEGPLWSERDDCVYWVDILGQRLHAYALADGQARAWSFPEPICWVIERERGGFICGLMSGFAELTLSPFTLRRIGTPYPHEPENRLNDAKADNRGRIWAGSMHKPAIKTSGALYRLNTDLTFEEVDGPYHIANGPTFSTDFSRIYHTDSARRQVFVFDIDAGGDLRNKRLFIQFPEDWGSPDGMTTDVQDGVWIAHWGAARVSRFTPDGRLDFSIAMPTPKVTSVCFAGEALDRLFVTSAAEGRPDDPQAGALFEVSANLTRGHTGLAPQRFGG